MSGQLLVKLLRRCLHAKSSSGDATSFGYRSVPRSEKSHLVQGVFDSVASSYDLMNDCMSLGLHRVWKDYFVQKLKPVAGMQVLDAAAGTGDIAFRLWQREPNLSLTLLDPNEQMLAISADARQSFRNSDAASKQRRERSDGDLASAAAITPWLHAFRGLCGRVFAVPRGILRRVHDILRYAEYNGTIACHARGVSSITSAECPTRSRSVQRLYDAYSFTMIPQLGAWIARDRDAYLYLVESIRAFPDQRKVCAMMHQVGFQEVTFEDLSFGVVSIYSGWKLDKNLPDMGSVEQLQGS
ncbi:2-hexaprenyl-6-methoxy-1,4-benzoquinone methyltransferase [Cyanidiococcus yangmingshanensis]|uniref:2-hexaprenyl-6-methoxy-1,4-benzoquinone methyltransferase n=1 Tax=Cyanidiococcus yangmingshanensis TaxID=2690220 RepID=A0A7J7IHQ0_9RHOD|nr:2-hexaprenyl-6-methoxy-1,4-benzoquinone methyltransferase [Cyanidiococcus yangmingshanensis]